VVERRKNPRCEHRRAPVLDELDHRVEVNRAIRRDRGREIGLDTGPQKPLLSPGGEVASGLDGKR
jgi:hypothetical protein